MCFYRSNQKTEDYPRCRAGVGIVRFYTPHRKRSPEKEAGGDGTGPKPVEKSFRKA